MKKKARKRADQRSGLDIGQTVKPVEKALNRLTDGTDEGRKSVARNQDIAFALFPRGEKFQSVLLLQRLSPGGVSVGFVSIHPSLIQDKMIFQNLLGGGEIVVGRARSQQGQWNGQVARVASHYGVKLHAIIPFFSGGIIAFFA